MSPNRCVFSWLLIAGAAGLSGCIIREPQPAIDSPKTAVAAASVADAHRVSLVGAQGLRSFVVQGEAAKVDVTPVPVTGQSFAEALRAEIKEASSSEWSVQVQAPTAAPVERGDVLLATFYVRATKPQTDGGAQTQFVFEHAKEPYTKSVSHSVWVDTEWRKVEARFQAAESYGAGEAQMIFRLGYDPETIEIGAIAVDNFGKQVALSALPTNEARDRVPPATLATAPPPVVDGGILSFEINTREIGGLISGYVYGINSQKLAAAQPALRRMGGNRQTAYNWEINASSAGRDWNHVNDDWPCTNLGYTDCNQPAAQMINFVLENQKSGVASLVTVPLIDFVSADKQGSVSEKDKAPSPRFLRSYPRKPTPIAPTPDLADGAVYQDEFVHFLVRRFGKASQGGVQFYALDNEPALWSDTHPRVHEAHSTYAEVVSRTEALATAITEIDKSAIVLGGIMYGFGEYLTLQSAPDAAEHNATFGTYLEYYLAQLKKLEEKHKRRLVHVLDVHWYPEVKGRARITEKDVSEKTVDARLAAPRSLWDESYREKSWITDKLGKPIRLIPWLKEVIAERYPGTKLAMTEYNYGAGEHISGGLAQVDVLGIFGREGLFMANYWGNGAGVGALPAYVEGAFKLYRNYDGKGSRFGDRVVAATTPDLTKASVYAAVDSKSGRLTFIIINKDQRANYSATIDIEGAGACRSGHAYRLDATAADIRPLGAVEIRDNKLQVSLPALSATLIACE